MTAQDALLVAGADCNTVVLQYKIHGQRIQHRPVPAQWAQQWSDRLAKMPHVEWHSIIDHDELRALWM